MENTIILIIFIITYIIILSGKFKSSVFAFFMGVLVLMISPYDKLHIRNTGYFIDFNMLGVLFGKMIIEATLRNTGLFQAIASFLVIKSKGNITKIFIFTITTIAFLSMFLDNVTTLMLFTPIVIYICFEAGIKPETFIFPIIFAANIGGIATIIGDYPNLLISSYTNIGFINFFLTMIIPVVISLIFIIFYFIITKKELRNINKKRFENLLNMDPKKAITNKPLLIKCLIIFSIVILGIIFYDKIGYETSLIALSGGALCLLLTKKSFEDISNHIEWNTLFFFFGFFTIVKAFEKANFIESIINPFLAIDSSPISLILSVLWLSGIASSLLGSVPVTTIMIPAISSLTSNTLTGNYLWWALALGAGFGSVTSLSSSISNLVVVNMIEKNFKQKISFFIYMRKGIVISLTGLIISSIFLYFTFN